MAEIGGESATIFDTEMRGKDGRFEGLGWIVEDIFSKDKFYQSDVCYENRRKPCPNPSKR